MKTLKTAVLCIAMGFAAPGWTGTTEAYSVSPSASAPVVTLQSNVTYARPAVGTVPANDTQVGFVVGSGGVLLTQSSGNTINRLTVTFEASVTDPDEKLSLRRPDIYLAGLPKGCAWDDKPANPNKIVCTFRQTRPGFTFPSFVVFYNAPVQVPGNGSADVLGTDKISTKLTLQYAEGGNGDTSVPLNSLVEFPSNDLVTLGTINPVEIKSAVAKDGANINTGDGGVPKNLDGFRNAELANVPGLADLYTVAKIDVSKVVAGALGGENCMTAGNFQECPSFQTTIADPFTAIETRFTTTPLTLVYRLDSSNLKRSANLILSNTLIRYTGLKTLPDGTLPDSTQPLENRFWTDEIVGACASGGVPNTNGLPCIAAAQCFRNLNDTSKAYGAIGRNSELVGDCEWVLLNNGNGFTRFQ